MKYTTYFKILTLMGCWDTCLHPWHWSLKTIFFVVLAYSIKPENIEYYDWNQSMIQFVVTMKVFTSFHIAFMFQQGNRNPHKLLPSYGKQAWFVLHNLIACDHNVSYPELQDCPCPSCTVWPYARCAFCTPCSCSMFSLSWVRSPTRQRIQFI